MDTKRLVIGMVLAMAIVFGWQIFAVWLADRQGWDLTPQRTEPAPQVVEERPDVPDPVVERPEQPVDPAAPPVDPAAPAPPAPAPTPAPAVAQLRVIDPAPAAVPVSIGSALPQDPAFRMAIDLTSRGAGIESIILNEFRVDADSEARFVYQQPYTIAPDRTRPLGTRALSIDGRVIELAGVIWHLEGQPTQESATFFIDIGDDQGPLVRLRKRYELVRQTDPEPDPALGYEVLVTQSYQSLTDRELQISGVLNGPTAPPREMDGFDDRQVIAGFFDRDRINIEHIIVSQFSETEPSRQFVARTEREPVVWAGASSVYFNAIIRPLPLDPEQRVPTHLARVTAQVLNPEARPLERRVGMIFETAALTLQPQASLDLSMAAFFGPKKRTVLLTDYYQALPLQYDGTLRTTVGACGAICTFDWIVSLLVGLLRVFHFVVRDWGLAIVGLVGVVRLLLHPITRKSTVSMYKMGKLGPELERLKKKHGDNKEELNKAMMQFYREQGFTPVLGCLPMFLQMPIWIALWQSLQNTFELRHAPFLYGFTWINDLSQPDRLITWTPVPLFFGFQISALNLLPLLLAVVFYLQFKFTPKPAATTPEQAQQQKMMQWMSLIFPVFLYGMPSGLNLYILTSTTIGIFESRHIRRQIQAKEEAEKAERVFVEAPATRGSKRRPPPEEKKPRGLFGWFADWQAKVEEMRRPGERRGR
jgi:YidC/Oxa1 family membrane protein insertase